LGVYPPDMPLDWAMNGEEDEVPLFPILDVSVNEEEFHRESIVACQKTSGRRDVLNLKSSINYGDDYATFWHQKSKAHMSASHRSWVFWVFGFLGSRGFVGSLSFCGWFGCSQVKVSCFLDKII